MIFSCLHFSNLVAILNFVNWRKCLLYDNPTNSDPIEKRCYLTASFVEVTETLESKVPNNIWKVTSVSRTYLLTAALFLSGLPSRESLGDTTKKISKKKPQNLVAEGCF